MPPTIDLAAATEAFVYGYPLVYDLTEVGNFVAGGGSLPINGPFNTLVAARDLLGPETHFVSPNNDTLYLIAMCDVRATPLVLDVPDTSGRYVVLQFVDAWTNNFAYVGTRTIGTDPARFLLAPGGYDGEVPEGATLIEATGIFSIVGRIQVHGPADLDAVRATQDAFALTAVDPTAVAVGLPVPDPAVSEDLRWWESCRVAMAAFPPPAGDAEFVATCAALGLCDATSPFVDADPEVAAVLRAAEEAGRALIDDLAQGGDLVDGWRNVAHIFDYNLDALGFGTIDSDEWKIADRRQAYALRAVAARAGLWGNHGYEAVYMMTFVDADGAELDGEHAYELRLPSAPPVGAFWSLTMYDTPNYYLVANEIDRYSIGDATPGLSVADDGSITITMAPHRPDADRVANWLPTPHGLFRPILRMYMPGDEILNGTYRVPAIRKLD